MIERFREVDGVGLSWLLGAVAPAGGGAGASVLSPVLVMVLCVVAGIGTVFLLPSKREGAMRKVGGVILLTAGLIFAGLVVRYAASYGRGGMSVFFWVFSAVAIFSAVRVITHPQPVYSALYFVLSVFATAGLFVLLWAEFMAVAIILIYAGAILVTYVFVIMLASAPVERGVVVGGDGEAGVLAECDRVSREPVFASAIGFALMGVLMIVIFDKAPGAALSVSAPTALAQSAATRPTASSTMPASAPAVLTTQATRTGLPPAAPGSVQALGQYLFKNQLVNLELAGLLLTVAMVGAILIARRKVDVSVPGGIPAEPDGPPEHAAPDIEDDPHTIPVYGTENPRAKAYPEA